MKAVFAAMLLLLSTSALTAQGLPSAVKTPYQEKENEGQKLVAELISRRPESDLQHLGSLKIRQANGKRLEVPIRMTLEVGSASGWRNIYEARPPGGKPQVLVIQRSEGKPNHYFLGTTLDDLKPLTADQLYQPFGHSDFWIADLGLEFLYWPNHKVVDKEMRHSRACQVVESTREKSATGYSRVLAWIDNETGGLVRAEAFDSNGKQLKEFSIKSFKKIEGRWQLKSMEILNPATDTRTRLEFETEVLGTSE